MQPLRQPGIHVQRHRRARERHQRLVVQRDGVLGQALEVVVRERHGRRPQHPPARLLGEPEVEGADDLRVDRPRLALVRDPQAHRGRRQAGELVLDGADGPPAGVEPQPLHERGQAGLDLDLPALEPHRHRVEMGQDQPRLRAVGQADLHEALLRVPRFAGEDL